MSINNQILEKSSDEDFTPKISQISLESVLKKEISDTKPNTQDWSALERENLRLRTENAKLKSENEEYLRTVKSSTSLNSLATHRKPLKKVEKCKNCVIL